MSRSLRAIDVGFDLRETKTPIDLADDIRTVYFDGPDGPAEVSGSKSRIVGTLADAGYGAGSCIVVERQPNGRDIRYMPDKQVYETQPANDNYWITCRTVDEARAVYRGDVAKENMVYRAIDTKTAQWIGNAAAVAGGYVAVEGPRLFAHSLALAGVLDVQDCRLGFLNGVLFVMRVPPTSGLADAGREIPERVLIELRPQLAAAGYATEPTLDVDPLDAALETCDGEIDLVDPGE